MPRHDQRAPRRQETEGETGVAMRPLKPEPVCHTDQLLLIVGSWAGAGGAPRHLRRATGPTGRPRSAMETAEDILGGNPRYQKVNRERKHRFCHQFPLCWACHALSLGAQALSGGDMWMGCTRSPQRRARYNPSSPSSGPGLGGVAAWAGQRLRKPGLLGPCLISFASRGCG